jgi:cell division septum initiation protein DivIVA
MKPAPIAALLLSACALPALAASPEAKALYDSAKAAAASSYKAARARCDVITGNPKDVCIAEAKAARVRAEADAAARYRNTLRAYTQARIDIAKADYAVDRTRCDALTGNEKDVCVERAKATRTAALADAKADKKVIEARSDAREDKRIAEYKVAAEKCDALAGTAKDQCVAAAKSQFGYEAAGPKLVPGHF